ncbi:MAG: DUF4230 domain-containing protein [Acidimicrobiia bacterium]
MSDLLRNETSRAANQDVTVRVVAEAPRRRFTIRGALTTLVAGGVAVVVLLVAGVLTGVLSVPNPFGTTAVDRSTPALLEKVSNLSKYSAAQGHFQQTVDVEDDVAILPSFLAGERTTFLANGTVDATVDFADIGKDAVHTNADGSVTVSLPKPTLATPVIDPKTSRVVGRERGVINRVAGIFDDTPTGEQRYYVLAQDKIGAAARHSHLVDRAERNTTKMLHDLLGGLGYTNVNVVFAAPTGAAAA